MINWDSSMIASSVILVVVLLLLLVSSLKTFGINQEYHQRPSVLNRITLSVVSLNIAKCPKAGMGVH